jgi:hypothetical protein
MDTEWILFNHDMTGFYVNRNPLREQQPFFGFTFRYRLEAPNIVYIRADGLAVDTLRYFEVIDGFLRLYTMAVSFKYESVPDIALPKETEVFLRSLKNKNTMCKQN